MNNGSLRGSRSTSRSDAAGRQNLAYRQTASRVAPKEEPQTTIAEEPAPPAPARKTAPKQTNKKPAWPILAGIVLLSIAGLVAWWLLANKPGNLVAVDQDKYQAVFLSNGQVYFGKLSSANAGYLQLTDVYYLERQMTASDSEVQEEQEQPVTENNFQLLKYSDVLYGSEDLMIISKSDVLRYENLRPDGVVARAIADRS